MRCSLTVAVAALVCALGASAAAQLSNKEAPAIVGHFHLNVTSVEAHRKFWVDTLGGTADEIDGQDAIRFPDTVLILRVQPPTGPTRGTAFDHIGFAVPDVPALTTKVVANGYQLTTGREPVPGQAATAATGTAAPYGRFSYLLGPDGAKVELVTNEDKSGPPIKYHHVHFINKQYVEMQQWYMKAFDATLRPGQTDFFIGADLPGVGYSLNFFRWEGDQIDHARAHGGPCRRPRRVRGEESRRVLQEARSEGHQADETVQQVGQHGVGVHHGSVGRVDRVDRRPSSVEVVQAFRPAVALGPWFLVLRPSGVRSPRRSRTCPPMRGLRTRDQERTKN